MAKWTSILNPGQSVAIGVGLGVVDAYIFNSHLRKDRGTRKHGRGHGTPSGRRTVHRYQWTSVRDDTGLECVPDRRSGHRGNGFHLRACERCLPGYRDNVRVHG